VGPDVNRVLVLGTADWDQPIATNQHYVVRELAQDFDLIYTESLGLRSPELKLRDIRRIARRLGVWRGTRPSVPHRTIPSSVDIRSPRVLPRHVGLAARINRPQLHSIVSDWIKQDGPRILWTYTPVTYGLEEIATDVVYHCVDLLGQIEGIPEDLIDTCERHLSHHATVALGTSEVVVKHLHDMGFGDVHLWSNVADTDLIEIARPATNNERSTRSAVFAGNLSTKKVDFALLTAVVESGVNLHLAGPIAEGGGSAKAEVDALIRSGATYHGLLDPTTLARLYWRCEVGLIPYVLNDYTRGVSPLKTFEYLAAGLSVVSTPVPAVSPIAGHVEVTSSLPAFVAAVQRAFSTTSSARATRVEVAKGHSWSTRGQTARGLVRTMMENV
jgi:teichuronic acid biosynthesis glycosyltransferase TuaH